MIRNWVFDMGMVMVDYHPIEACRHFCPGDEAGAQQLYQAIFASPEWLMLDHGTITEAEALPIMQSQLDTPALRAQAAQTLAHWDEYTISPNPGMGDIVRGAKARGLRVYLLSNASLRLRSYQQKIPAIECFDGLLVSAEERLLKPEPAIYLRLCERFDLRPEECLFIDDIPRNVEGARAVGMQGYHFTTPQDFAKGFALDPSPAPRD